MSNSKRVPDSDSETPTQAPKALGEKIEAAIQARYEANLDANEAIRLLIKTGQKAAYVRARVGDGQRVMEFEVFVRDVAGPALDGALGPAVDFLDSVLEQYFDADRDAYLPIDYVGHPYEDTVVFARQQARDLVAEAEADKWLNPPEA